ncbi:MAG: hypothetical protein ACE5EK_06595 [Nitrospinales bacterium]
MGLSDEIKSIFRKKSNTKTKTIKKFQGPTRPTTNVQKFRSSGRSHGGGGSSLNVKNFIKSGGTKTTPKEVLTNFQNDLKNNKVKLSSESKPKRINLPKPNQIQPANSEPNKFVKISFASAFSQSAKNLGRRFVNTNPYKIPPLGDTLRPFDYMVDPVFARKSPAFTTPKFGTIGLKESPFRSYGESTIGKRAQQLNFERGFPLPSNLGERKSKAGEVVKFAAFSNPLTSAILTKTEIDKEKKVIGKKGVINPKTSSGTVFASLGIIPFGSLGRIKKLERSVAFSPLKSLEKEPFSTGQVLKLKDGSGSFSLSGERSFGGFKEKITMKGKINKVGKNSFFIPRGKGSSKITGKLNTGVPCEYRGVRRELDHHGHEDPPRQDRRAGRCRLQGHVAQSARRVCLGSFPNGHRRDFPAGGGALQPGQDV